VTQSPHGFGDEAAEMANETEVEAPADGASAPAGHVDPAQPDTTCVDNWVEEGGPLEPSDVDEVESGDGRVADQAGDTRVAELTADLQRLQAEFLNYKRRVERDREMVAENATYRVLVPIIEVLDTVDRAREHGDLDAGFAAVADQLERVVTGLGLTKFGTPGEPFDPNLHEALSHIGEDPEVEVTTCKVVAKAGYRIGERVVRAAQVLVVDPA
jgi:molecular chaperone GrpE